jgi:hypothetical protein
MGRGLRARLGALRIVWAITARDVVDAAQNRVFLSVVFGVLLLSLTRSGLAALVPSGPLPVLIVVDEGGEAWAQALQEQGRVRAYSAPTADAMREGLVGPGSRGVLGVVIPAGLRALPGDAVLAGYYAHQADARDVAELGSLAGEAIGALLGRSVRVETAGHAVYPPTGGNEPFMESATFVIAVLAVATFLVPYLMVEEKETHTIDALLLSPAGTGEIVAGKALAGVTYGVLAGGVLMATSHRLIVHWDVALAALAASVVLGVGLGLLLGLSFATVQSMSLWSGLIMFLLIAPMLLGMFAGAAQLPAMAQVARWVPTSLLARGFRAAFWEAVPPQAWAWLGGACLWAAPLYAGAAWRLRRLSR